MGPKAEHGVGHEQPEQRSMPVVEFRGDENLERHNDGFDRQQNNKQGQQWDEQSDASRWAPGAQVSV